MEHLKLFSYEKLTQTLKSRDLKYQASSFTLC